MMNHQHLICKLMTGESFSVEAPPTEDLSPFVTLNKVRLKVLYYGLSCCVIITLIRWAATGTAVTSWPASAAELSEDTAERYPAIE